MPKPDAMKQLLPGFHTRLLIGRTRLFIIPDSVSIDRSTLSAQVCPDCWQVSKELVLSTASDS